MRKLIAVLFLLAACAPGTEIPTIPSTSTPPLTIPTAIPSATAEALAPTDIPPTEMVIVEEVVTERTSPVDGMPQVYIPAGTFRMGGMDVRRAENETPVREVTLDAFWMDQLEVTNAMYLLCVRAGGCTPPQNFRSGRRAFYFNNPEFNDYPVVYVTWGQAKAYCTWAGRRLPSEAEWERAGRGDDFRTFPWGESKADYTLANFNMLAGDTSRVGSYPLGASPFGVLDMAGNAAEWVNDVYSFSYNLSDVLNPTGPSTSSSLNRVVRGGSLGDAEINIRVAKRSSVRGSNLNAVPGSDAYLGDFSPRIGFRCVEED
jgi:eukaryotic-like serine/threonine-protein kinase